MCFGKRSSVDEGRQGSAFRIGFLNNTIFKDLMKMFFNRDLGESFNRELYKVFYLHQAHAFHLHRSEQKINESSKDEVRFPLVSFGGEPDER